MTNHRHEWVMTYRDMRCKKCGRGYAYLVNKHIKFIASPLGYNPDDEELNKTFPCLTEDEALVKDILV